MPRSVSITPLSRLLTTTDALQATSRTAAASPPATKSPARATARPTTPTSASPPAPRATARPPTLRSSPTVSRPATAPTSSPLPRVVPLPPRPARLVPLLRVSVPLLPRLAPRLVSRVRFPYLLSMQMHTNEITASSNGATSTSGSASGSSTGAAQTGAAVKLGSSGAGLVGLVLAAFAL